MYNRPWTEQNVATVEMHTYFFFHTPESLYISKVTEQVYVAE